VLYCAKKAGVTHILKAGGAQVLAYFEIVLCFIIYFSALSAVYFQAISAMAWGTASCPKVFEVYKPIGYMSKISSDLLCPYTGLYIIYWLLVK